MPSDSALCTKYSAACMQVRVIHRTEVGEWSEGISLGKAVIQKCLYMICSHEFLNN